MTTRAVLRIERSGSVAILTLNRPEVLNAINARLITTLASAWADLEADRTVRAVVLTGAGRGFCAGADLRDLVAGYAAADYGEAIRRAMADVFHPTMRALFRRRLPLVVAVNGIAAGGGVSLALCGDILVASQAAAFELSFVPRLGFVPDLGASALLPLALGWPRARAVALLGERFTADQARAWGMVWDVTEASDLIPRAVAIARRLADGPIEMYARVRALDPLAPDDWLCARLDEEQEHQAALAAGPAFAAGVQAFLRRSSGRS